MMVLKGALFAFLSFPSRIRLIDMSMLFSLDWFRPLCTASSIQRICFHVESVL